MQHLFFLSLSLSSSLFQLPLSRIFSIYLSSRSLVLALVATYRGWGCRGRRRWKRARVDEGWMLRQLVVVARVRGYNGGGSWSRRQDDGRRMGDGGADRRWRWGQLMLLLRLVEREEASLVRGRWFRWLISAIDSSHGFPTRLPSRHTYGPNAAAQVGRRWRRRHLFPDCTSTSIPYWQWLLQYLQYKYLGGQTCLSAIVYVDEFCGHRIWRFDLFQRSICSQNCALTIVQTKIFAFVNYKSMKIMWTRKSKLREINF